MTRLMPNIGGSREAKRRLVASVVKSKLLYASPVWTSALNYHAIQKKLFLAQRGVVLRIVSTYPTVSTGAVLVLASVPPIDLLAEGRKETFRLLKSSLLNQSAGKDVLLLRFPCGKCRAHTLFLCQMGRGKGGCRSGSGRTTHS